MPAIIVCNRKWLLAGDDLIFPCFVEAVLRAIWIVPIVIMIYLHIQGDHDCNNASYVTSVLIILLFDFTLNSFLCGLMTLISSRGSIMQVERRCILPKLIYFRMAIFVLEILISISIAMFIFEALEIETCIRSDVITFLEITLFILWVYICSLIIVVIFLYDPTGSAKFWNQNQQANENDLSERYSLKSKKMWENRLKLLFCMCLSKRNRSVYKEIATFLASFFKDIDFVPSDTIAGLVILGKKHASEKKRLKFLDSLHNNGYSSSINEDSIPTWMTVENAIHFLRLAKSTYGWPMFLNPSNPCSLCALTTHLKCCFSTDIAGADNCCSCNSAALQKVTGLNSDDILYVSYNNAIYEPAFFVAIDREKSCVVVCIRGTLSLSDIVTDMDGESEMVNFGQYPVEFHCHRGTHKSALYIYQKLTELKILVSAFTEFPNFQLVITGHSLGGSIASVLGFILLPSYPDLQCYSYGPLAVMSGPGAKLSYDFIFTVIVGDDLSPRLCVRSCIDLRSDVVKCLQECKIPKYKLLLGACSRFCFNTKLGHEEDELGDLKSFDQILKNNNAHGESMDPFGCTERLYAPGRILFLEYTTNTIVRSSWRTGFYFQRLIVTPRITRDHQPHRIQKMLECVKTQKSQETDFCFNRSISITDELFQTS